MEFEFHDQFANELKGLVKSGVEADTTCAFAMYSRLDTIREAGRIVEDISVTINEEISVFVIEVAAPGKPLLVYQDSRSPAHPGVVRCLVKVRQSRSELDELAQEVATALGCIIRSLFYPETGKKNE